MEVRFVKRHEEQSHCSRVVGPSWRWGNGRDGPVVGVAPAEAVAEGPDEVSALLANWREEGRIDLAACREAPRREVSCFPPRLDRLGVQFLPWVHFSVPVRAVRVKALERFIPILAGAIGAGDAC
jgi:hypothetical protein